MMNIKKIKQVYPDETETGYDKAERAYKKKSQFPEIWRRFKKKKTAMFGLAVFVIVLLVAIFADLIVPYSKAIDQVTTERLLSPSLDHPFGTDAYGRDIFARIVYGARYSLLSGISAVIVGFIIGGLLGAVTGYYGGIVDAVIMRILDAIMCVPFFVLALAIIAALGTDFINVLLALVISSVPTYARIVRSAILTVVDMDFIEAARACGTPNIVIIIRHVLPNAIGPIIVQTTMSVGQMIKDAAAMSFLGMGIQPPTPEWGSMLSEGKTYMLYNAWMVVFPGLAITITSLALNLMGDGLRDALDPRLKD